MIHLLLFYFLPALVTILLWVTTGWKFSLNAAPAAYRAHLDSQQLSLKARAAKAYTEKRHKDRSGLLYDYYLNPIRDKSESPEEYLTRIKKYEIEEALEEDRKEALFTAEFLVKNRNLDHDQASYQAKLMGKKCIKRGPFAYFLTPGWATKIECNWYPVEVNVKKIQDGAARTLATLKEINGLDDKEE